MPIHPGKLLIILGLILTLLGLLLTYSGKVPFLGKLPGDLHIERENFSLYLPLGTCLLLSLILSLVFWLFRR